jgi:hypothetical protein
MLNLRLISIIELVICLITFNFFPDNFRYFIFLPIINYILLTIKSRHNLPLTLFFIYAIIFYLYLIPRFIFDLPIVYYFQYDDIYFYNKSLLVIIIYLLSLMFFVKPFDNDFKFPEYSRFFRGNNKIVVINCLIMLSIYLFGFSGKNITDDVKYGTEDFGEKSVFTEYFILFLIIALVHTKNHLIKWGIILFSVLMMVKCVLYGSRVSALLILLTIFTIEFANRFSVKTVIISAFIGILVMNLLGILREQSDKELNFQSLARVNPDNIMASTQSNMFYGSVCFVGLLDDEVFTIETRVKAFVGFIIRLFLPSKLSFEEGSLTDYGQKFTDWGGGAHPATYFYVWFGWLGPVLFGWIIAKLMNLLKNKLINKYWMFVALILIITVPRWYGYEPGIIFKMSWVGLVILIVFENIFFKNSQKENEHTS